jgi:hypothetical protein
MSSTVELRDAVHDAFRQWHDPTPESPLGHLCLIRRESVDITPHQAANQILSRSLEQLAGSSAECANLLRFRYVDRMEFSRAIRQLNMAEATFFRRQNQALALVAEMLEMAERAAHEEWRSVVESRLELRTYERLFGVDEHLAQLLNLLEQKGPPWIVLLKGMGGIGKTALADCLIRRAVIESSCADIAWVTARQRYLRLDGTIVPSNRADLTPENLLERLAIQLLEGPLPSPFVAEKALALLQAHMVQRPCLVVVDNLETVADLDALLPILRQLANPAKFLLTSRESLDGEAFAYPYPIPPLTLEDALALVRHEALARNLPLLAAAPDADLIPIYRTVGGNPLALRLVVGQICRHALPTVLEDLHHARGRTVEQLYTFIYRRAWDLLTENERQAFVSLPLIPESGAGLSFIHTASGLAIDMLHDALETLVQLSLVDHHSSLHESRYTIHSLTRTFLLEQVIRWQA